MAESDDPQKDLATDLRALKYLILVCTLLFLGVVVIGLVVGRWH